MAKQLGFMVIEMGRQFVDSVVDEDDVLEVRNEPHFHDLHRVDGPSRRVLERLQRTLPTHSVRFAATWQSTCFESEFAALFKALHYTGDQDARTVLMDQLRHATVSHGMDGGW